MAAVASSGDKGSMPVPLADRLTYIAGNLLHKDDPTRLSATDRILKDQKRIAEVLAEKGDGSALCGWRRELDRQGWLEVGFQEFCQALVKWGIEADIFGLLCIDGDARTLSIEELLPRQGSLVNRFREWIKEKFGHGVDGMFCGSDGLFAAIDPESNGYLTRQGFLTFCQDYGFEATLEELGELWIFLDPDLDEQVKREELLFLETDVKARGAELHKQRMRAQFDEDRLLARVYWDGNRRLAPKHRLAQRPWEAFSYEQLPVLAWQRKLMWRKEVRNRIIAATKALLAHFRTTFGHEVRAWRRGLDPDSKFVVSLIGLRCYCRKMELDIDVPMAWRGFDKDGDGRFHLEDLTPRLGTALAFLRKWAREKFGVCSRLWDQPKLAKALVLAEEKGKGLSRKKIPVKVFANILKDLGWPGASTAGSKALCAALDLYGCGFISRADLEWLDMWQPPDWLIAMPDQEALDELQAMLLKVGGQPLHVWRRFLDTDDTNCVSWIEFESACQQVHFKGNISGAWRCLDKDSNGSISLSEYDPYSATLLRSFKEWAEENFGSVERMFKAMDTDGSGQLSFPELRRACRNGRWQGDVRHIFDCLDIDSYTNERIGGTNMKRRTLSYKEIAFLDAWVPDESHEENSQQTTRRSSVTLQRRRVSVSSILGVQGELSPDLPTLPMKVLSPRGNHAKSQSPIAGGAKSKLGSQQRMAMTLPATQWKVPSTTGGSQVNSPSKSSSQPNLPMLPEEPNRSSVPTLAGTYDVPSDAIVPKLPPASPSTAGLHGLRAQPWVASTGLNKDFNDLDATRATAYSSFNMTAYSGFRSTAEFSMSYSHHRSTGAIGRIPGKPTEAERLAKLARLYAGKPQKKERGKSGPRVSQRGQLAR